MLKEWAFKVARVAPRTNRMSRISFAARIKMSTGEWKRKRLNKDVSYFRTARGLGAILRIVSQVHEALTFKTVGSLWVSFSRSWKPCQFPPHIKQHLLRQFSTPHQNYSGLL